MRSDAFVASLPVSMVKGTCTPNISAVASTSTGRSRLPPDPFGGRLYVWRHGLGRIVRVSIDGLLVTCHGGFCVVPDGRHGTNTTLDTLASSPTDWTSIRIRHSRGASSPPEVRDFTAIATST